tara:strand:+ start:2745 stop:2915 length:171 start_codon:yes stop_codon:yes gene_type:complete
MEKKYSVEEILSAVQDLNNLKKNTSKIALKKPKKINVDNSDIPPSTLELIEEAEGN